jgi:hypothetical protein
VPTSVRGLWPGALACASRLAQAGLGLSHPRACAYLQNLHSGCPLKPLSASGPLASPASWWRLRASFEYSSCSLTKICACMRGVAGVACAWASGS